MPLNRQTWLIVLFGFALRLFLIFPGPLESKVEFLANKADLRNYYWPAQAVLQGENPYTLWASGQSGDYRADMAPLELLVYVATTRVWNDPRAIQVLFAIFDTINIGLLGILLTASPLRLPFQVFYAFGPLTLYNLVLVPEDKTIVLTLTLLIFYFLALPKDHELRIGFLNTSPGTLAVVAAAVLASFKWLSVFYLLPLLIFVSRDFRSFIKYGVIFGGILALAHLPWFPAWSYVYAFRSSRVDTPLHIAPAALLNMLGLFDRDWLLIAVGLLLLLVYSQFWAKRIDIFETMALSVAAGILWTPDMDPVHLSIVVLYFLLVLNWSSRGRQVMVWGLSFIVAGVYAVSTRTGFTRVGLPDLRILTGNYGSAQMILWSYVLFIAVFIYYLFDKAHGYTVGRGLLALADAQESSERPQMDLVRSDLIPQAPPES
jgi:hypothetical protein